MTSTFLAAIFCQCICVCSLLEEGVYPEVSKEVTWYFTPSQTVRLNQGECTTILLALFPTGTRPVAPEAYV